MTGNGRRGGLAVVVVLLVIAGLGWQYAWRTRPDRVGPRFVEALMARHPGTTIGEWRLGRFEATLPTGVAVDARLLPLFDECRSHRLGCSEAIERSLDDVDRVVAASREPDAALLEPVIVDEPTPGFRFGYVTEPLIGTLEVRYALVTGIASTFVTAQIASRLGFARPALHEAALERLRSDATVRLVLVDGPTDVVYRVETGGDAPASLLDRDRMKRLAAQMKTDRLYVAIPERGLLHLAKADGAGASALAALASRAGALRRQDLLVYDPDAADGSTLSFARTKR